MTFEAWFSLAFLGGAAAAIVHFKTSRLGCFSVLVGLPCVLLVVAGGPLGFEREPFPIFLAWAVFAFPGYAAGVAAVVLRIVR